ncbi:TPA: HNH endonuclease [Burkholderia cenocepacia]
MDSPCIPFDGYRTPKGYGRRMVNGKMELTHRIAYCEHHGLTLESIKDQVVRHQCDNPSCINPLHLEIGTQAQNVADAVERDRRVRGDRHPAAKINSDAVQEIRSLYRPRDRERSIGALAKKFGISRSQVHRILRGEKWKSA